MLPLDQDESQTREKHHIPRARALVEPTKIALECFAELGAQQQ
jgi:hypothetical protein